jgi:BCCT family betaine/carnitine transporter
LERLFFVTSSDSGSLVIDGVTAGGKHDAPVPQRIVWVSMEGLPAGCNLEALPRVVKAPDVAL